MDMKNFKQAELDLKQSIVNECRTLLDMVGGNINIPYYVYDLEDNEITGLIEDGYDIRETDDTYEKNLEIINAQWLGEMIDYTIIKIYIRNNNVILLTEDFIEFDLQDLPLINDLINVYEKLFEIIVKKNVE
jgi:hypothetical protein